MRETFGLDPHCPESEEDEAKLESVFSSSSVSSARPPAGSRRVMPSEWSALGAIGKGLKAGLDGMKSAGQDMDVYATPEGEKVAYPKIIGPGKVPMKADDTKAVWSPVSGSDSGGANT